jgi:hypothetical protein
MITQLRAVALTFVCLVIVPVAGAQAQQLTVNRDLVAPGGTVNAVVTGNPGQNFALVGSTVGSGLVAFGVPMQLGTDYVILAVGVLNSAGQATVIVTPPFQGTTLDRYYIQAALSPSPAFNPLTPTNGVVLRNMDLLGPTSLATVHVFNGVIATVSGNDVLTFAGPTATVPTTATQRLVGSAVAPLGVHTGTLTIEAGMCYQNVASGPVLNFVGDNYGTSVLTTNRAAVPAAASVVPGAGTWRVGFCVRASSGAIDNNDYVNGWVMVVNQ